MPVNKLVPLLAILCFLTAIASCAALFAVKRSRTKTRMTALLLFSIINTALIASLIVVTSVHQAAQQHGMYDNSISAAQMFRSLRLTPKEDELPSDLRHSIILYYRFTCSDCEDVYPEINRALRGRSDIYWVSTRSEQGAKLIEQYPVEQVPTGVYIDSNLKPHIYLLFSRENGKAIPDNDAIQRLLDLQARKV